jgi:glycosyltransferase involved in cell wall biosynthesis
MSMPASNKTIGIYLGSSPDGGGTYQYNLSIIKALETFDRSRYRVFAFFRSEAWKTNLPDAFEQIFVEEIRYRKVLGWIYRRIDRSKEGLRRFSSLFNPMVAAINKSSCDLVIFPSQDALSYQCNKQSLCAIHDLMHRYESQFNEYKFGEYAMRERHYANICRYAAGILADSELGKKQIVESYTASPDNVFVLPFIPPYYLLNAKTVDVRKKYKLPERYVFYPAQFWEHKNHLRLLDALKILRNQGVEINLVLTGAPRYNNRKVLKQIQQLGLGENVFFL